MVQATPFLLLPFLALGAPGVLTEKCNLMGRWKNDLGSNMTIYKVNEKGDFAGIYYTAVSTTSKKIEKSPLVGSQHRTKMLNQPTFGFIINWSFSDNITVFTGQCFVEENQKEVLRTMWLLRSHVQKRGDDWKATLVGYNTFKRLQ